jgi:hypothetical protein
VAPSENGLLDCVAPCGKIIYYLSACPVSHAAPLHWSQDPDSLVVGMGGLSADQVPPSLDINETIIRNG